MMSVAHLVFCVHVTACEVRNKVRKWHWGDLRVKLKHLPSTTTCWVES